MPEDLIQNWDTYIYVIVFSYILGSIPFGLILTKAYMKKDIRDIGSGNIGATNVLRTGNKKLALATLILDMGKSVVAVLLGRLILGENMAALAGIAAVLGHIFPIWLKFKGGKGVASGLAMFLALNFKIGFIMALIWLCVALAFQYSSLAAIIMFVITPILAIMFEDRSEFVPILILCLVILYKHRDNFYRLLKGKESKIKLKKETT